MSDPTGRADTSAVTGRDPGVRTAVRSATLWPLWIALGVVAVPFAVGIDVPLWVQYLPLAVSGLAFGMPHGAVDHLVPARLSDRSTGWSVAVVTLVYLLFGGGYLLAWFFVPVLAAVAFVVLTWFHWGQGDVYLLAAVTDDRYPRSVPHRVLTLVVRGAMPMAVPLVAFPEQYRRVVADLVGLFGGDPAAVAVAFTPGARLVVGGAVAGLAVATLLRGAAVRSGGGWTLRFDDAVRTDAAEVGLLAAFFATVPPILAVGLYFCLWHSVRHVVRLLAIDDAGARALSERRPTAALARFGADAVPTTAVALVLVGALYPLVPNSPGGLGEGIALYLVVVAALTVPHVVVVTWMDLRQGIWSSPQDDRY